MYAVIIPIHHTVLYTLQTRRLQYTTVSWMYRSDWRRDGSLKLWAHEEMGWLVTRIQCVGIWSARGKEEKGA